MKYTIAIVALLVAVCSCAVAHQDFVMPDIIPMAQDQAPVAPTLPSVYSVGTFGLMHGDWSDGRFYYDYDQQKARVDATYNGGFLSMIFDYSEHVGYTMTTFRDQVFCESFPLVTPLNTPDYLSKYAFKGIAYLAEHGLTYVWESQHQFFATQIYTFTDAETGEILANVSDRYFLGYFDYQDGLPHDMFSYIPSQCPALESKLPADATVARNIIDTIRSQL